MLFFSRSWFSSALYICCLWTKLRASAKFIRMGSDIAWVQVIRKHKEIARPGFGPSAKGRLWQLWFLLQTEHDPAGSWVWCTQQSTPLPGSMLEVSHHQLYHEGLALLGNQRVVFKAQQVSRTKYLLGPSPPTWVALISSTEIGFRSVQSSTYCGICMRNLECHLKAATFAHILKDPLLYTPCKHPVKAEPLDLQLLAKQGSIPSLSPSCHQNNRPNRISKSKVSLWMHHSCGKYILQLSGLMTSSSIQNNCPSNSQSRLLPNTNFSRKHPKKLKPEVRWHGNVSWWISECSHSALKEPGEPSVQESVVQHRLGRKWQGLVPSSFSFLKCSRMSLPVKDFSSCCS